jgi:hypothetical protein
MSLVVTLKCTDVSEVLSASIIVLMMEAVRTSEMSVHFNVTKLHTCRRVNLKYHNLIVTSVML